MSRSGASRRRNRTISSPSRARKTASCSACATRKGRTGTLTLALPRTISIFEVDPRQEEKEGGLGPVLYKEWKLTAPAAGGGLFGGIVGKGQKLTLVLHGHGRGCTDASHFTAWTLLVHGRDRLTLTGALER